MKRIIGLILSFILVVACFAGCSEDKGRILYNVDLEDYVTIGEYKGIKIDKTSEEYVTIRDSLISYDVTTYGFYNHKRKGEVRKGDIVNIDYVGKKDGVAFSGGTASGYDLEIGSGTFIPGFEEGLAGEKIGSTVNLDLTFPENYGNADLAGQDVVFTVTINYVKSTEHQTPEQFYKFMSFSTVEEYYKNLDNRTLKEFVQSKVIDSVDVADYPQEDLDYLYTYYYENFKYNIENNYGMSIEQFYEQSGETESSVKTMLVDNEIKPAMKQQMAWYAIFDKENMEITKEDTEKKIKEIIAQTKNKEITRADVIEELGEYYIEILVVSEKVFDFLIKNAEIS